MVILLLIFKLLFFFGYSSMAIYSILTKKKIEENYTIIFLYSLGIGPALATLFLYYLLIFFPGYSSKFYISTIFLLFSIIILLNYTSIKSYYHTLKKYILQILNIFIIPKSLKRYLLSTNNIFIIILLLVAFGGINILLFNLMPGHDFFEYLVQGKYFFENKSINYVQHHFNIETGFYYVGLHGWSFPLHSTIELMFDDIFYYGYHLYFKSLTLIYGLIILSIIYIYIKKYTNLIYSLSAVIILILTKGFLISIYYFHIDSYRMYFFILSFIFCISFVEKPSINKLIIFSLVTGISSFSHSLGVFISVIYFMALIILYKSKFQNKIFNISLYVLLILLFGGIHYLIDIFYGTGWLIKSLKFY